MHQNLVLRWVRDETVYEVWQALIALGLGDAGADQINDVVSCPGTDSCKLGITSSMGLNHAVRERVESMGIEDELTKRIHIKMSGCPNGCSQHHIANIGFYGASIKVGEHTIPAYVAHIGGNYEGGEVLYGKRLKVRLPAKRVPDAVERWLRMYEESARTARSSTPSPSASARHASRTRCELSPPVEFSLENMAHFIDWQRKEPFQVIRVRANARCRRQRRGGDAPARNRAVTTPSLVMACSFQKEESVLIDMLMRIEPTARVFTIDTGVLFPETYEVWRKVEDRYGLRSRWWTPRRRTARRGARRTAAGSARWTR